MRREHSPGLRQAVQSATGPLLLSPTQFSDPSDTAKAQEADGDWGLEDEGEAKADASQTLTGSPATAKSLSLRALSGSGDLFYQPSEAAHPTPVGSELRRRRAGEAGAAQQRGEKGRGGDQCLQAPGAPWPARDSIGPALAASGPRRAAE